MMGYSDESSGVPQGGGIGPIGAIVNTGAMLYDSYQNRKTARRNVDMTIAAQKAEAELAYQRSVAMWNEQNLYNSPQAQMQRFVQAGLNPHLIYGQGNSGNASTAPQYQPANLQYRYEAPQYGAAFQSILPTLMAVGTWMQNMRKTETEIDRGGLEMDRVRQVIDYLTEANPQLLRKLTGEGQAAAYSGDIARYRSVIAYQQLADLNAEYRHKYGDDLWRELYFDARTPYKSEIGGIRKLQFLEEESKRKLLDAKASWSEFDVTDPQAIMMLVLNGVMGLAGQTLRLSTHRPQGRTLSRERPRGLNRRIMSRNHPDR